MNILDVIHAAILSRFYRVSGHAANEMLADEVSELDAIEGTLSGEIVESYPQAFPFPACLVSGKTVIQTPIHTVWAFDSAKCYAILVTVYRPDPERWTTNFKVRVKS